VSKTVKESLESGQLSAPRLLHDIDQFLTHIPPAEWRRRATDNVPLADMPLRTVKTILQQIVSVYGENVFEALDEIQSAESSFVYQYLFRLANSAPVNGGGDAARSPSAMSRQPSTSSMGSTRREPVQSVPSSPAVSSEPMRRPSSTSNGEGARDIEVNQELKRIFDQIGDPVNSRVVSLTSCPVGIHH
jgi:cytoskeleton-associated protein 5